jgi:hypothetical protein
VVPTTTGEPSALAIVCGVFCLANPVDRQLPDTVFHLRKNVVYAGHALGSAEDGDRCRVVQRGDRCSEPSKSCILVTQNFRGPGDRLRQFLGVCLLSRDKVCHNERTPGNPNIQIPEGARPPRPHSLSCPRHQFDSTSATSTLHCPFSRLQKDRTSFRSLSAHRSRRELQVVMFISSLRHVEPQPTRLLPRRENELRHTTPGRTRRHFLSWRNAR